MAEYEQIELSSIEKAQEHQDIRIVLYNNIVNIIKRQYGDPEGIEIKANKLYYSLSLFDRYKFRIKEVKNQLYFEIPRYYEFELIKYEVNYVTLKDKYLRIPVPQATIDSKLEAVLLFVYAQCFWRFSNERFDCCSSYMECSDLKSCIHKENKKFSASCRYNRIMTDEKIIFFGKNRNAS